MTPPVWFVRLLPSALVVLMLAAACVYLLAGQWWRAVYWLSGALLNIAVTYGF